MNGIARGSNANATPRKYVASDERSINREGTVDISLMPRGRNKVGGSIRTSPKDYGQIGKEETLVDPWGKKRAKAREREREKGSI